VAKPHRPHVLLISIPTALVMAKTSFGWRDALATLWPATDRMTSPALLAAWTLCFEMLFYAAVTAVLVDRRLLSVGVGVFAAAMALRARGPIFQFLGNPIIFEFVFGVRCRTCRAAGLLSGASQSVRPHWLRPAS
jgi:exopolysaccharide production protein ExoZ